MYNKFSFYSIVVQTVAPEGSSATEGLKDMYIKIEIVTRLNDGQSPFLLIYEVALHILFCPPKEYFS